MNSHRGLVRTAAGTERSVAEHGEGASARRRTRASLPARTVTERCGPDDVVAVAVRGPVRQLLPLSEGEIAFIHTETDPRFAGRGLGGLVARGALDDARARGLHVLPYCPFIWGWIGKHPEYADLLPEARPAHFGL